MDVKLNKESLDVIVDDKVVKSVELTDGKFGEYMKDLIGEDTELLEAMRFIHRKMKVVSTTFVGVKND